MSEAFVETTVLTNALLKPGPDANAAKSAIRSFQTSLLPVYAIKEFKAGPLSHYVWLHGKLFTTNSWEKTLAQLGRAALSPFNARKISTSLEAMAAAAHKNRSATLGSLEQKYGTIAEADRVTCDRTRLALALIIKRAWRKRRQLTSRVVDELGCFVEGDLKEERGLFDVGDTKCSPENECALAARLRQDLRSIEAMQEAVRAAPEKPENVKRLQALTDLLRLPKQKLMQKQCRQLGDAVFAFFCPADAVILTTNERDLRPLAEALGKKVQTPIWR